VDEGLRSVPEQVRLGALRLARVRPDKRNIRFSSGMTSPMRSACIHVVIKCQDISRLEFRHHPRPATIPRHHLRPGTIAEGGAEGWATTIVAGDHGTVTRRKIFGRLPMIFDDDHWQFVALRSQGTLFERPEQRSQPNLTLLAFSHDLPKINAVDVNTAEECSTACGCAKHSVISLTIIRIIRKHKPIALSLIF
jgi:hypothetical protein